MRRNILPLRDTMALSQGGKERGVRMMVETYFRRGRRELQRLCLSPTLRAGAAAAGYAGSGFLLSAASLMGQPQPLALGLICGASGWQAVLIGLGAMVGYPVFWGFAGRMGFVWAAVAMALTVMVGQRRREAPLMLPFASAFLTAATALAFRLILDEKVPLAVYALWVALALGSTMLFMQAFSCRDAVTDWLVGGVAVLALAQVSPWPYGNPGYLAAGLVSVGGAFPAAALAGLGLDLAQITAVPMTAVMCMAYFLRLAPLPHKWQRNAAPAFCYLAAMVICGIRDPTPLPGLLAGGALGSFLPPRAQIYQRRGGTGFAQVRLELGAETLAEGQRLMAEIQPPPIDVQALLDKAGSRACGACSARKACAQKDNLTKDLLFNPLDADCRKPGRLIPELHRAREQWKDLKGMRQQQREYQGAIMQQYRFLSQFLRSLADRLPRQESAAPARFQVEASARSKGKEKANGDRCLAFPGPEERYYVLLCDGMGTGLGAAQEGAMGASYIRRMLQAGFPSEHVLRTYNSFLALRGAAGAVTVDMAEVDLQTGLAKVYKWGAAPSWILRRSGAEKIGTATPPPGISVEETREAVVKLSLRRGEVLILLSDGVDGEGVLRQSRLSPDAPPGELAAEILEMAGGGAEDDATAAVIRLRPADLCQS